MCSTKSSTVWCVCAVKNLLRGGKKTKNMIINLSWPDYLPLYQTGFFLFYLFKHWKVEPLPLVFHCSGTQSCMSVCTVAFSCFYKVILKLFLDFSEFSSFSTVWVFSLLCVRVGDVGLRQIAVC